MTAAFHTAGVSRTGRRPSNEDTAAWATFEEGPLAAFALVCDGMGGHNAGEVASAMGVEIVERRLRELAAGAAVTDAELETAVRGAIGEANKAILERGQQVLEQRGMGTTLALAIATRERRLLVANIGDSRIFMLRGLVVEQLSVDHTALAEQRRALGFDLALPEDGFANPFAHALTRSLGQELKVEPDVRHDIELRAGDLVVVTSDGVTDVLEAERLLAAVESTDSLESLPEVIYNQAFEAGSRDNITVVVLGYGLPGRLGTGQGPEPEREAVTGTVPLWRSPSGAVRRVMPPAAAGAPAEVGGEGAGGEGAGGEAAAAPAAAAAVAEPAPPSTAAPEAEPPALRSRLGAAMLAVGLPIAAVALAFAIYQRGVHGHAPAGPAPALASPSEMVPMPLMEPVPVSAAVLERAELVPVGAAWGVTLRFRQPVSSQSTELTLAREKLAAGGRALVEGPEATLRLPCEGFGTPAVTCSLAAYQATAPPDGESVTLDGQLGDGLRIETTAVVRAPR